MNPTVKHHLKFWSILLSIAGFLTCGFLSQTFRIVTGAFMVLILAIAGLIVFAILIGIIWHATKDKQ